MSLAVMTLTDTYQDPHPESRLMLEEDEPGEGDDGRIRLYASAQERIALGRGSRKIDAGRQKYVKQEMIADADENEEAVGWEREQLRRGDLDLFATARATPKSRFTVPPHPPTNLPELSPAVERLAQSFAALKASHASSVDVVASFSDGQEQLDNRGTELHDMVAQAEAK
ncbi:Pre-mRNA-splicing factor Ntr2 [Pisolithus croceorrhizus]|nr:Pre-mRNA-splicing factor Ntr2 [Pisolithus croceorrhizus]